MRTISDLQATRCNLLFAPAFAAVIGLIIIACSEKPTEPTADPTLIKGTIRNAGDSAFIANANIVVYDANTNAPVARTFSSASDGTFSFPVAPGAYYLKVSAQGYKPDPLPAGKPVFFQVAANTTAQRTVYLTIDTTAASTASISGNVTSTGGAGLAGILIVAASAADSMTVSTTSGPDGFFVLYNVPAGTYSMGFLKADLQQDSASISVTVTAGNPVAGLAVTMSPTAARILRGKITFLASKNGMVDITLVHPVSREAIPGLFTFNDTAGLTYELRGVPPGTYIVWASYRNDGYVMDPDWIRKNGFPAVTVTVADTARTIDFSVTDTIGIRSPTNPPDSVYPVTVTTTSPQFKWGSYPSAKEYIIEVSDIHGSVIWGGYDSKGTILHKQIGAHADSAVYNFDNSAKEPLKSGETYRWKLYADNSADPDIQGLISSSEDLRGLFMVDTVVP